MGVSFTVTTPRWLRGTLPRLQTLFHQHANTEGLFPILTQQQHDRAQQMMTTMTKTMEQEEQKGEEEGKLKRSAAILVPIVWHSDQPCVLFTKRSSQLKHHTSEISFPGGHTSKGDTNRIDTALRETAEELGGDWSSTIIIGECTAIPSLRGISVTAVIGVRPEPVLFHLFNPNEVEQVFPIPVQELLSLETSQALGRLSTPAPVYPTPYGTIWGLTAYVLKPILHQLFKPVFFDGKAGKQP